MEHGAHALGTSLAQARLGMVAQPVREQQLVEQLQAAAGEFGCPSREWVTALYLGLKLRWRVLVCGPARERAMACFDVLVRSLVGGQHEQALHVHGPIGADHMSQRFAALRVAEFVGTLLDPREQGKAWFLLIDVPGDATATLRWVEREVAAAVHAHGVRAAGTLPPNLFVLVAASEATAQRGCLSLRAPDWESPARRPAPRTSVPVGVQRYLLDARLTTTEYRRRLRNGVGRGGARAVRLHLRPDMVRRWLAASVDGRGQGLWIADDAAANVRAALAALERWALAPTGAS